VVNSRSGGPDSDVWLDKSGRVSFIGGAKINLDLQDFRIYHDRDSFVCQKIMLIFMHITRQREV
jgi:hypothetical protein